MGDTPGPPSNSTDEPSNDGGRSRSPDEDATIEALSRRKLLAATSLLGAGGFVTGYTRAQLSDQESVANQLTSGMLDLEVRGDGNSGSDGSLTVDFDDLEPGESGSSTIKLDLPQGEKTNNPAYLWTRTFCPESNQLAQALDIELWYVLDGDDDLLLFDGTLCELTDEFRDGEPLDADPDPNTQPANTQPGSQTCLDTREQTASGDSESTGPLTLRLDWELDELISNDSARLEFEFAAIACRHEDGTTNPFDSAATGCECTQRHGISHVSIYHQNGEECVHLGKLELSDKYAACSETSGIGENYIDPGTYTLYQDDDCGPTGYEIDVLSTTKNAEGETTAMAFRVFSTDSADNSDPILCQAIVKGGPGCAYYGPADFDGNATRGEFAAPIHEEGEPCPNSGGGKR